MYKRSARIASAVHIRRRELQVVIPITTNKGLKSHITTHFGGAPQFLFVEVNKEEIKQWIVEENPAAK